MYCCTNDEAQAAAGMLLRLSQLSAISLGVHSCFGSDLDRRYPDIHGWDGFVKLPPLGSLTALTELWLAGMAALPPDFGQLSRLRRPTVVDALSEGWGPFDWRAESLAGLASLTCVEVHYHSWKWEYVPGESWEPGKARSGLHACIQLIVMPRCNHNYTLPLQTRLCWPQRPTSHRCMPPQPQALGGRSWQPCART